MLLVIVFDGVGWSFDVPMWIVVLGDVGCAGFVYPLLSACKTMCLGVELSYRAFVRTNVHLTWGADLEALLLYPLSCTTTIGLRSEECLPTCLPLVAVLDIFPLFWLIPVSSFSLSLPACLALLEVARSDVKVEVTGTMLKLSLRNQPVIAVRL